MFAKVNSQSGIKGSLHNSQNWQWAALVGFVMMEMAWVIPWMRSLNADFQQTSEWVVYGWATVFVIVTNLAARAVTRLSLKTNIRRVLLAGILVFGFYTGLTFVVNGAPPTTINSAADNPNNFIQDAIGFVPMWFWVILASILLWWRGIWLSRERLGPITVKAWVRFGIVMYLVLAASGFVSPLARSANPGGMLLVFLFAGLFTLISARISALGISRGGVNSPFDLSWLLAIFLATGGFVFTAYSAALIATGQAEFFLEILTGFFYALGTVFALPVTLIFVVLAPGVEFVRNALPTPTPPPAIPEGELIPDLSGSGGSILDLGQQALLSQQGRILVVVLGVVLLLAAVLWSVRHILRAKPTSAEDLQTTRLNGKDLWNLLRKILRQRVQNSLELINGRSRLMEHEKIVAAERIRQIYAEFLNLSAKSGVHRRISDTPLEFAQHRFAEFPGVRIDIYDITNAYVKIRYGEMPETRQEIAAVEAAWIRIQAALTQVKSSHEPPRTVQARSKVP